MARFLLFLAVLPIVGSLRVSNRNFYHGSTKVFLSGMNLAWKHYGTDFGRNVYLGSSRPTLIGYLNAVKNSGGNSVRLFLHAKGEFTPQFDTVGYVTATDSANTMRSDLASFLDEAKARNIMVFIALWDGAVTSSVQLNHLFWDLSKLQTYIDRALKPLVAHVQNKPALGGWDILNEPEGLVYPNRYNANPCFDTRPLANSGANWVGSWIPMNLILRFINHQVAAIKEVNSTMLTTVGTWSEKSCTDSCGYRNYYKDSCLIAAGGKAAGKLDFYQIHTYATNTGNTFNPYSPLRQHKNLFRLNKPVVIGEFSEDGGDGRPITTYMNHAYTRGYSGAWTWQANGGGHHSDSLAKQQGALRTLRWRNVQSQGGLVNFRVCPGTTNPGGRGRDLPIQRERTRGREGTRGVRGREGTGGVGGRDAQP